MTHLIKIISLFLLIITTACASQSSQIQKILEQQESPPGIVFEIVSPFEFALKSAIPKVLKFSALLRKRFPKISIAVVTHGNEQFALTSNNESKYKTVHKQIKSLTENLDIPVHICATYAEMNGVDENEFPDYIDIAASGPSQIANYQELGYILIKL